jgi:UDP-N-acetylmuramyl pentapeptide phosphotransferase/UDP-N-acetylglucosamine-1-phosphate transferase
MPATPLIVAVAAENRWLITFSLSALCVLAAGIWARQKARRSERGSPKSPKSPKQSGGVRRRAGGVIALGPLIGLACSPVFDTLTVVIAVGAVCLAAFGILIEHSRDADRLTLGASVVAAIVAAIAGAELGPTGVPALDALGAVVLVVVVTQAFDGLGNADSLAPGVGATAGLGIFALAAFASQDGLATVTVGLVAACFSFLAFNSRPASLYIGRGGRLAIGYVVAVGALAIDPIGVDATRQLVTSLMLVSLLLLDTALVATDRLRRRRSLMHRRSDHMMHRLVALGWTTGEAVMLLVLAQLLLSAIALFTGRAVIPVWLGAAMAIIVLLAIGAEAVRGKLDQEAPPGVSRRVVIVASIVGAALVVAIVPAVFVANDAADLMLLGRDAASHALVAARQGDTITAQGEFNRAALVFTRARDKLASPLVFGSLGVPFVASNVRAARALADIGTDLANAGESLTTAVHPEALEVVGGRLPLDEVTRITPELERGAAALTAALQRLNAVRDDPYLAAPVRDAVNKVHEQLVQAEGEARRAAAAAKLAPAIFGGDGPRRYLLVVQNNAESRATGGFIGSYGVITAENGKLDVGDLLRTGIWNNAIALHDPTPPLVAPADYFRRYNQFSPVTTLQNVNLSPDFPSVTDVLLNLAPQAGVGEVDGVMSVDPIGLAALLTLTGPVTVNGWPTPISDLDVVSVTLRDAYAKFAETPERADFLGDVAQAAVDRATSGTLGRPANIAQVLGAAAHEGHIILGFARPEEQRLAVQLGIAEKMGPIASDAVAVTTSNAGGNKIDYYLQRTVEYHAHVEPNEHATEATVSGDLVVDLDNQAPSSGLPQIVIGPFDKRFAAGDNVSLVSLYSPLGFLSAAIDKQATNVSPGRERGRNVYSVYSSIPAEATEKISAKLAGTVPLHNGWYSVEVRHQPTLNADRVRVSVDVPEGWRIDKAPHMRKQYARLATTSIELERTTTFRVHITQDPSAWDIWERLRVGT